MIRRICVFVFLLPFMVGFTTRLAAQSATTSLRGTVEDQTGSTIPNATVTITDATNGTVLKATTSGAGDYSFTQIPPAHYTIAVSANGFADSTKSAELLVSQPATINFALSVHEDLVTVDVSAEAQTLNTTDASMGNSMNSATIEALPMEGRNVPDLLSLQPGVLYLGRNAATDSRNGAVSGGRSDQGNVTLDGLDDNDQVNGYAFTGVLRATIDSTEEFRVTTSNAGADFGRSSGAQVNLVTKSGTNLFHGSLYEYYRPSNTVANDWFNKQAELASGEPNIPGKLIRNTFGGSIGGPIKKNKLFFFFNYEGQRTAENTQVTQTVPTQSFRNGIITYAGADGSVASITPDQVSALDASLDPSCSDSGTCSWGPGPNPHSLTHFQAFPLPNGSVVGDGYNTASYTFSSPSPATLNTSIVKLDYLPNANHHLFVRGNFQKDTADGVEQFPGNPASSYFSDDTKGISAGWTWMIKPTLVNNLLYGYIRQSNATSGVGVGDYVDFRFLSDLNAETRNYKTLVPVQNVIDNMSWTKGKHTIQFGANYRMVTNDGGTDANSFNNASTNPYWLYGNPPDPSGIAGLPEVDGSFSNSYEIAFANLVGTVPSATGAFNYKINSGGATGSLYNDGQFITRHFRDNEFEWYIQDAWRILPNLTITAGLRHSLLQTPYATDGQQIAPTIDTDAWFRQRNAAASQGVIYEPNLDFSPNGPSYGKAGYWPWQKLNFAPRLAIAYSPDPKTSIRAGFGLYFDHFGQGLVNAFSNYGSFGLTTSITNPAGSYTIGESPRFTGVHDLPNSSGCALSPSITYPYAPPSDYDCGFAIAWGIDNKLKTPYSEVMDFSVQRELPSGFIFEAAYVGRLGRHLLENLDLAEPTNFVDTQGGGDYFTAGAQLSKLVDQNGQNPEASVPAIPYFEDVFPQLAGFDYPGESATQAIYTNEWAPYRTTYGATTSLADLDFYCGYGCNVDAEGNPIVKFWQKQFSSLYSFSTMGMSYYNAAVFTLRHPMTHGFQVDASYTFSHSIDMGSDTERTGGNFSSYSYIINTWKPSLNRASSDFDARHLITATSVYQLPFGRGKQFASSDNGVVDAIIGGWQLSGLGRWTSGLPFGLFEPGWTTDWQIESYGVTNGPVPMHKHLDSGNGNAPEAFKDQNAINAGVDNGGPPVRLPYPGEAGERNNFRGDGYFDIDTGLTKSWNLHENYNLKFAWEVFNVTNSVRFDVASLNTGLLSGQSLGAYSTTLSRPRVMQFSLRIDF